MDLEELQLQPHLEGSPRLYARRGEPAAALMAAVRAKNVEDARDWVQLANPNVFNKEIRSPLSVAVNNDQSEMVELLLEHGADPYFPLSWALRNPTSGYTQRLSEAPNGMSKALYEGHWHWAERFAEAGFPRDLPSSEVESWLGVGLHRGMPVQTWKVLQQAAKDAGLDAMGMRETFERVLQSKKGVKADIEEWALLAKENDPSGYLKTWEAVLQDACGGHEQDANGIKWRDVGYLVELWFEDSLESGVALETVQSQLVGLGGLALKNRRPGFLGGVVRSTLRGYDWTVEERLNWLGSAWDDSYPLVGAPVTEILNALRKQWKPSDFKEALRALHAKHAPGGGLWMAAIPDSTLSGTKGQLSRITARMNALLDNRIELPEEDHAKWLSRLSQAPGANKVFFWESDATEPFLRMVLLAGMKADSRSLEGASLQDLVETALAKSTNRAAWQAGLNLLRESSLDGLLPAAVTTAVPAPKSRF